MSDGMSDSRAYDSTHEKWTEVDDLKFKRPLDVFFWHFRDGVVAECIGLDIEFDVSRWDTQVIEGVDENDFQIGFFQQDSMEKARQYMKYMIKKKLKNPNCYYRRYVETT